MRTKALLLTAAVGAISVASTLAQVYSVNVVGFVNVSLSTGFNFLANPLKATNDTVSAIIPTAPDGTTVATWNKATQTFRSAASFGFGSWDLPAYSLPPGEAFFVNVPSATTLTFVGEVRQGTLATPLVVGYNLVGSQVAQAGPLGDGSTAGAGLGYAPQDGDTAALWDSAQQKYKNASSFGFGAWDVNPVLGMAEGVVITRSAAGSWTRTFNVQ
jgi:hypothetical protein